MSEAPASEESQAREEPTPLSGNTRLGKYLLLEELGRGGMAVVYLAVDQTATLPQEPVVIKVLRDLDTNDSASWETSGPTPLDMFLSEAALLVRLKHPNIVKVHEACSEGGKHIIVMEYLDGRPLNHILTRTRSFRRPLELNLQLRIMADVLAGLHHAHELRDQSGNLLGVVHRDISPHNIFISYSGAIKVLDFGIAKQTSSRQHTEAGVLKGKIAYMSPEQVADTPIDRRTDIFAFGIVLWEMLTGEHFWRSKNELQILHALLNGFEVRAPSTINPAIPARLSSACVKALAFSAEHRFATCEELRQELLAILSELPAASNREIGRLVSEMFRDLRERHSANIVGRLHLLPLSGAAISELERQFSLPVAGPESTTATGTWTHSNPAKKLGETSSELTTTLVHGEPRSRFRVSAAIALGTAALAFSAIWTLKAKRTESLALHSDVAVASPMKAPGSGAPSRALQNAHMTITLRVSPSDAKVTWDGRPLVTNPAVRKFKRDGNIYEATISAPGYETKHLTAFLTGDQTFVVTLEKAKRGRTAHVTANTPAAPPVASAESETPSAAEPAPAPEPHMNLDNGDPWR